MASLTKAQIKDAIKEILRGADLSQLSSKKVRKQLEEKYEIELTNRRKEIDELLMAIIEGEDTEKDSESEDAAVEDAEVEDVSIENATAEDAVVEEVPVKAVVSSSESDFDEPIDIHVTPSKKLKKSSQKRKKPPEEAPLNDEELARRLQEEEEEMMMRRTRRSATRPAPRPRKSPSTRTKRNDSKSKRSKPKEGYLRSCLLSPALANVVGTDRLPNNEVVKKIWEISRERNLFDPKNKSFIICDDDFYKIFKRRRVRLFGCMKYLGDHIISKMDEEQLV